jgi:ParB-like chromosome segregation protein Spo0J
MQVEVRPIKSIRTAKYNPRKISDQALESLKQSIERFGFVDPVIVNDRTGVLVGGHQRVKAAKELGLEAVPVVGVNLDEGEEKALNVALNKISGEWDLDLLKGVLEDIQADGLDLSLTGFDEQELASLLSPSAAFDYSLLDDSDHEGDLQQLQDGVKRGIVIDFDNLADYQEAAAICAKFRQEKVDIGPILLVALRQYNA